MASLIHLRIGILGGCLMMGALSGCARSTDPTEVVARVNETNIQRLANLYFAFQMQHAWRGPASEQEFKEFLRGFNPDKLTRIGIDPGAIDALFVSERDGQPFKIRYSVAGSAMGSSEPVVFESVGLDGRRLVGFLNMEQKEVDAGEYDNLWNGTASSSPTGTRTR